MKINEWKTATLLSCQGGGSVETFTERPDPCYPNRVPGQAWLDGVSEASDAGALKLGRGPGEKSGTADG